MAWHHFFYFSYLVTEWGAAALRDMQKWKGDSLLAANSLRAPLIKNDKI
jgi:hypothetical protein